MEFRDKPMQNLVRIPEKDICKNAQKLLLDGETVCGSLQDGAGSGGFYHSPHHPGGYAGRDRHPAGDLRTAYRKVLHFGIQTAGFGDPLQASQLTVCFADEHEAKFGFIGQDDLFAVANAISRRIL